MANNLDLSEPAQTNTYIFDIVKSRFERDLDHERLRALGLVGSNLYTPLTICTISRIITNFVSNTGQNTNKDQSKVTLQAILMFLTMITLIPKPFTVLLYHLLLQTTKK